MHAFSCSSHLPPSRLADMIWHVKGLLALRVAGDRRLEWSLVHITQSRFPNANRGLLGGLPVGYLM